MEVGKRYFIQKNNLNHLNKKTSWEYQGNVEMGHLFTHFNVDYIIPDNEINKFTIIEVKN